MAIHETGVPKKSAILVGLQLPDQSESDLQESLNELQRLVTTLGNSVVGRLWQKRNSSKAASVLGEGKLKELALWTEGTGVIKKYSPKKRHKAAQKFNTQGRDDLSEEESLPSAAEAESNGDDPVMDHAEIVIVDAELSPSQLRNLESALGVEVLDRTGVIIEIFSQHAKTREARLQIEIARLKYLAPRLREAGDSTERQGGGIGGKGAGESSQELDKRRIRDRIKELKEELEDIQLDENNRKSRRSVQNTLALVGYTNAGKSSLMRALTGSEVLVADKLFATLGTTVRSLYPPATPNILITDTVGFIRKLPHDLVASFRSTLEEAASASLLLHVVDCSDPAFPSHIETTRQVLGEIGALENKKELLLFNKIDQLTPDSIESLKNTYREAIFFSTRSSQDVARIREKIIQHFESTKIDMSYFIPFKLLSLVAEVRKRGRVLSEEFTSEGQNIRLLADEATHEWTAKKISSGLEAED